MLPIGLVCLLFPPRRSGFSGSSHAMAATSDHTEPTGTVDQEAATAESTDESNTVPQDDPTVARPHLLTLLYRPDTPAKLTDKFPVVTLRKRPPGTFIMGRGKNNMTGQNLDVLLNDEHMPRKFIEIWCVVEEEDGVARWYIKNLSDKKVVRVELNGTKMAVKFNEVKELRDGYTLKLEMLALAVKIEEGDIVDNADFDLEFKVLEDSSSGNLDSFHRQISSSTESSGSITSATDLARQMYRSTMQNGMHVPVNQFGHVPPLGIPPVNSALGSVYPAGQFPLQGGGGIMYPFGGQVQAGGVAVHTAGGAVVYCSSPAVNSMSGAGSNMSAVNPYGPANHHGGFQHNPNMCCQAGYSTQHMTNTMPNHQHALVMGHMSTSSPVFQSGASGSHQTPVFSGSQASPGPVFNPGAGDHHDSSGNPAGHSQAAFFSYPGQRFFPAVNPAGHQSQQSAGQYTAGNTGVMPSQASAGIPQNRRLHGETKPQAECNQPPSSYQQAPSMSPNESTKLKEFVSAYNNPGTEAQNLPRGQIAFHQFPTQEHSVEFNSNLKQQQQQQQSQWVLADRLHGPMSMPQYAGPLSSTQRPGFYRDGAAPQPMFQAESAASGVEPAQQLVVHEILAQQPESARLHNFSGYQPESAQAHNLSQQLESATLHSFSGQQSELRSMHTVNKFGQQPVSAAFHSTLQQGLGSTSSLHQQQASKLGADNIRLAGLPSASAAYLPSSGVPAAPPVFEMSRLTLGHPIQVTETFPTEPVSATPANSLIHSSSWGSGDRAQVGGISTSTAMQWVAGDGSSAQVLSAAAPLYPHPPSTQIPQYPQNTVNLTHLPVTGISSNPNYSSLNEAASNGNCIQLRDHQTIAAPTPPSSDFSSSSSFRVQDLRAVHQSQQDHSERGHHHQQRQQPEENDERQPEEHEDNQE